MTGYTRDEIDALPYLLTVEQAARVLNVSKRTLYVRIAQGDVRAVVSGGVYRVPKVDLLMYAGLWELVPPDHMERIARNRSIASRCLFDAQGGDVGARGPSARGGNWRW